MRSQAEEGIFKSSDLTLKVEGSCRDSLCPVSVCVVEGGSYTD